MTDNMNTPELWIPPGMRLPQVGDRVRVRLSGECEAIWPYSSRPLYGHQYRDLEHGRLGVIFRIHPEDGRLAPHHVYAVGFDIPYGPVKDEDGRDCDVEGATYAAIELELFPPTGED